MAACVAEPEENHHKLQRVRTGLYWAGAAIKYHTKEPTSTPDDVRAWANIRLLLWGMEDLLLAMAHRS
jgi:hypothetical protein